MREIKFNIWDPKHKLYDGPLTLAQLITWHYPQGYDTDYGELRDDLVFLQYIGLKDINGKEIYEGDIVKSGSIFGTNNPLGYVAYFQNRFLIRTNDVIIQEFSEPEFECEIVGNIYEYEAMPNELLKEIEQLVEGVDFDLDKSLEEQSKDE